jgi:hypothetical protein
VFGVLLVCVSVLAACSTSTSSKTATTRTIGNSVPISEPATVLVRPIGAAACFLLTAAQVKTLLGAAATGIEKDAEPVSASCSWTATPAGATSANRLDLGLIRIGNGQVGFATTLVGLTASVFSGLGDAATYSTGKNPAGTPERLVVTNKGTVSLSIGVAYAGTPNPPSAVRDDLTAAARRIFAEVHA